MRSKDEYAQQGVPSLADQWRRHLQAKGDDGAPVLLALPSGMQVKAGRTNILTLIQRGSIPDALTPKVEALIAAAKAGGTEAVQVAMTQSFAENPARFQVQWTALLNAVWIGTVVEPRFYDPGPVSLSVLSARQESSGETHTDPDAIPIDAVSEEDKAYLFSWCQGVTQSIAAFREQRTGADASLGLVSEGGEVRATPGRVGRDRPVA